MPFVLAIIATFLQLIAIATRELFGCEKLWASPGTVTWVTKQETTTFSAMCLVVQTVQVLDNRSVLNEPFKNDAFDWFVPKRH
jgi:hypothetical protein